MLETQAQFVGRRVFNFLEDGRLLDAYRWTPDEDKHADYEEELGFIVVGVMREWEEDQQSGVRERANA